MQTRHPLLLSVLLCALGLLLPSRVATGRQTEPASADTTVHLLRTSSEDDPNVHRATRTLDPTMATLSPRTTSSGALPYQPAASKTAGWITLLQDGFENLDTFLATWDRFRIEPSAEVFWFPTEQRVHTGARSVTGAGEGADLDPAGLYPDNTDSWLRFGPFDLSDASQALLTFFRYVVTPNSADKFFWGASTNGNTFNGFEVSGRLPFWTEENMDLGLYLGRTQVWIAFHFKSDGDGQRREGAFVDDVLLEKNNDPFRPVAPTLLSPGDGATDLPLPIGLDWNDVPDAATYQVQVSTSSGFTTLAVDQAALTSSVYYAGALALGTTYYWRVRASNVSGNSPWSTIRSFKTIPAPPGTPVLLSPANGAVNLPRPVALDWEDTPGATSYRVQIALVQDFSTTVTDQAGLAGSTFTTNGLNAFATYFWRVRAVNTGGASPWTAPRSFTTLPDIPGAPVLLAPSNGAVDQPVDLLLDWDDVTGATSYQVQLALLPDFSSTVADVSGLSSSSYAIVGLSRGVPHYWRARATNAGGTGPWSAAWLFTTVAPAPAAPTLLSPADAAANLTLPVALDWSDVTGAATYQVQVSSVQNFSSTLINQSGLTASTFSAGSLAPGAVYFWRARAANAGGSGPWSAVRSFSTRPNPPSTPVPLFPANGAIDQPAAITLDWSTVSGAASYQVQVSLVADFGSTVVDAGGLVESQHAVGGLSHDTTYHWRVRASNAGGDSPWSGVFSFRTAPPEALPAPALLAPANGAVNQPTSPTLDWNAVPGDGVAYEVQVAADAQFGSLVFERSGLSATDVVAAGLATSTTVYWRVRAVDATRTSPWSATWQFATLPAPPAAPLLSSPAEGANDQPVTLSLDWGDVVGAATYHLQVSTTQDFSSLVADQTGLTVSQGAVSGLSLGATYYWRVRASNIGGTGPWSSVRRFTTVPPVPGAPSLLIPSAGASLVAVPVLFDWTDVPNAAAYRVQVATTQDFSALTIDQQDVSGSSLGGVGLPMGTTYYWRVRAANVSGVGPWSDAASFTTVPAPPSPPALLSPADRASNLPRPVALDWSDVQGADSYRVQVSTAQDFANLTVDQAGLPNSTFTTAELLPGTTYFWRSRAAGPGGPGAWSIVWQFTTLLAAPEAPVPTSPSDGATQLIPPVVLAWNVVSGASTYQIQVATVSSFASPLIDQGNLTGTSLTTGALEAGITYYWRVRATNIGGTGPWSAARTFTTKPNPPSAPVLLSPADGAINLNSPIVLDWGDVGGAGSYQVQVATSSAFSSVVLDQSGLVVSSYSADALAPGARFFWRARASGAGGTGAWSSVRSFSTLPASPAAPALFAPANDAVDQPPDITLDWVDVTGAESYHLQLSIASDFSSLVGEAENLVSSQFSITGLARDVAHYWRVRASNAGGTGPWSDVWSFRVAKPETLPSPALISPANGATNQPASLVLDWNPVGIAGASYDVQLAGSSDFNVLLIDRSGVSETETAVDGLSLGTLFYWRVRATDPTRTSPWSAVWQFRTSPPPPGAPTLVSPAAGATNLAPPVNLDWNDVSGATTYHVQLSGEPEFGTLAVDEPDLTVSSYTVAALDPGRTYHWRTRASNVGGESPWSTASSFTTLPALPAAPLPVSPAEAAVNVPVPVPLDWTDVAGAASYRVQVARTADFSDVARDLAGLASSTASVNGLASGTVYFWRAAAVNAAGQGPWSAPRSFATLPDLPGAPTLLGPQNGASNLVPPLVLDWTNVSGAATYEIQIGTNETFSPVLLDSAGLIFSSFELAAPPPGATYFWRARAINANGPGPWSASWSFSTAAAVPEAPVLLTPADEAVDLEAPVPLDWTDVVAAAGYRVQVSTTPDFASLLVDAGQLAASSYLLGSLEKGKTYYWRARGFSAAGQGSWSAVRSFRTLPLPPAGPILTAPGNGASDLPLPVAFDWADVPGAISYRIQVSAGVDFVSPVLDETGVVASAFAAASLSPGGRYFWRVRAVNAGGAGPWSATRLFSTLPGAPPSPTLATPAEGAVGQPTRVTLDWEPSPGADGYAFELSLAADFSSLVASAGGLSESQAGISGLAPSTLYYWRARASNAGGESDWSPARSFSTAGPDDLPAPALLAPANGAIGLAATVTLQWAGVGSGAVTYDLQLATNPSFSSLLLDRSGLPDTQENAEGLRAGTTYFWRVRAHEGDRTSGWSATWTIGTLPFPPAAPAPLAPAGGSSGLAIPVNLAWSDVASASSYRLQISTASEFSSVVLDEGGLPGTTFRAEALLAQTTYFWRVRAGNAGGDGPWSEARSFATVPNPPAAPKLVTPAEGAIDVLTPVSLDWSDVARAVTYQVQVSSAQDFSTVKLDVSGLSGSTLPTADVEPGGAFFWRARAVNAGGPGPWSGIASFRTAPPLPEAPAPVAPENGAVDAARAVLLDWRDVSLASGYQVQVSTSEDFSAPALDETGLPLSHYQVEDLLPATTYFWRSRGTNAAGAGLWSDVFTFTTAAPAPASPSLSAPGDGALELLVPITFGWGESTGALVYHLQVDDTRDFLQPLIDRDDLTALEFQAAEPVAGGTYFWRVRAGNAGGFSAWSTVRTFRTLPDLPAAPELVYPVDGATDQPTTPTLDWTTGDDAAIYQVQVAASPEFQSLVAEAADLVPSQAAIEELAQGSTYLWRVRAINAAGIGPWSEVWSFATASSDALPVPALVSPSNDAGDLPTGVTLTWRALATVEATYQVQLDVTRAFTAPAVERTGLTQAQLDVGELEPGRVHYWRVRATDGTRTSDWSAVWQFGTVPDPPVAPVLAQPAEAAMNLVAPLRLDWEDVQGASSYQIQLDPSNTFASPVVDVPGLTTSSYTVDALEAGRTYYWRARASYGSDPGAWSDIGSFRTRPLVPAAPNPLAPEDGAAGLAPPIALDWTDVPTATGYRVQISTSENFSSLLLDQNGLSASELIPSGLSPGTRYHWRTRAVNEGGAGPWSPPRSFETVSGPPAAPALEFPAEMESGVAQPVVFRWTPSPSVLSYQLQIASNAGFTEILLDETGIGGPSFTFGGLAPGTTYCWRVRALAGGGTGAWSNPRTFSTLPEAPGAPEPVAPGPGDTAVPTEVTLDWRSVDGASTYEAVVSTRSDFSSVTATASGLTESQLTVSGLEPSTAYFWRVRAVNQSGASGWSGGVGFTTIAAGKLAIPSLISPPNDATDRLVTLMLTWNPVGSGSTTYRVQVADEPSFASPVFEASALSQPLTEVAGLGRGTPYFWRVGAADGAQSSGWSAPWRFSTLPAPPDAPVPVSPSDSTLNLPTDVVVTWEPSSGARWYRLQVATTADFSGGIVLDRDSLKTPAQTLSALAPGTRYHWRVRGLNSAGYGPWSTAWEFVTTRGVPTTPRQALPANGLVAVALPAVVSWDPVPQATSYTVHVSTDQQFKSLSLEAKELFTTELSLSDLTYDTVYFWRVQAVNADGVSLWSAAWSFRTAASPVAAEDDTPVPLETRLLPNYPNPFNPSTTLTVELASPFDVTLTVYDLLGRVVTRLIDETLPAGVHRVVWQADGIASGTYFGVLRAGRTVDVRSMVLVR